MMENERAESSVLKILRQKAEDQLKNKSSKTTLHSLEAEILNYFHELEVRSIELEIQNEELRLAKSAAQDAIDLYDFAPTGYFSLNTVGEITRLNLNGAAMLGKERSLLMKSRFGFFVSDETKPIFNHFLEKIFKNKTKESCELILKRKDNSAMFVLLNGIMAENGENCLIAMDNITDHKQAEAEIGLKNENLQKLIATKDKFFSIIAHDLRSPFQAINWFSELLVRHVIKNEYNRTDEFARIILQSSKRAMDLLTNLMDWSRSQTGRMDYKPEYFEIGHLINEITPLLDDIARQKSIYIQKDLPSDVIIFADQAMISTVCRNLISNAIKFTPSGGKISLRVTPGQNSVQVSVKDSGIGIPENRINHLFSIDQSHSTLGTNNEPGTGLGLILCKEFIDKHSGNIWVESQVGKGSTFYFTLKTKK